MHTIITNKLDVWIASAVILNGLASSVLDHLLTDCLLRHGIGL